MDEGDEAWAYMLRLYARPGVAPACLRLQEEHGLDIPLLLALLHARAAGRALDGATVARLDREVARWREEVIRPLRAIRTAMKSNPWMTRDPGVPGLRAAIKSEELRAERIEVAMLARLLADLPPAMPGHEAAAFQEVARLVLDCGRAAPLGALPTEAELIAEAAAALA